MAEYMKADCTLTLSEALDEFYGINSEFRYFSEKFEIMRGHDAVHVLFGSDTSFMGEAIADLRSMFSTNIGAYQYIKTYLLDSDDELKAFLKSISKDFFSFKKIPILIWALFYSTCILLPRIWLANRSMTKRWDYFFPQSYMNERLCDLREKYNITIVR